MHSIPTPLVLLLVSSLVSSTLALTLSFPRSGLPLSPPRAATTATTTASFETYAANPKLLVTPIPTPTPTSSIRPDPESAEKQTFQVTKDQLEGLLQQVLQFDFQLQVVSGTPDPASASGDRELLGEIPVQIKVRKLRIGGLSAPRVHFETLNDQRDPVNYGNIRT
ncbi:hypothetical protein BGX29_011639 [Mortierella sp. GBA35]|nr:hypothetical protein BGX29_011639 [Mortierella sp. GBA35]